MKSPWEFIIVLLLPTLTYQKSDPSSPTYVGAVAEYSPVYTPGKNFKNVENYLKFIKKASEYDADILVFPEHSLYIPVSQLNRTEGASYIPDPKDKKVPCTDGTEAFLYTIKNISCAARDHKMYVVINHQEKVDCNTEDCPSDSVLIYNTNIVFDRTGAVIARYRKYNLFMEPGTNITDQPENSTFKTDFNVTFGQFICFDILFDKPALNLIQNLGITDLVYSANWVSILPFAFSSEAQAAWSYANDVNFLAAGLNNPRTASGGTGIYVGRKGYISVSVDDKASNNLIVANIPKFIDGKRSVNIDNTTLKVYKFDQSEISSTQIEGPGKFTYAVSNIKQYVTKLIDFEQKELTTFVYHNNLKCEFHLELDYDKDAIKPSTDYYRYRLMAFNGVMSLAVVNGGAKICGVLACLNETIESCGHLHFNKTLAAPVTFKTLQIKMTKMSDAKQLFLPITLSNSMKPLNRTEYFFSVDKPEYRYFNLTRPHNNLLTFAIYGRNFESDGEPLTPEPSSASKMFSQLWIVIFIGYLCINM